MTTTDDVAARGELCAPSGRRSTFLVFVHHCPVCGYAHTHRATAPMPAYTRSPSCSPHLEYTVTATPIPVPVVTATA